jgi:hypothetical protein
MSSDGGGRAGGDAVARPLHAPDFAGLESFVRTPDDDVDDDGMNGMILGLGDTTADDPDWQLAALEPPFPDAAAGPKLPFQFMDATANAAAPAPVDMPMPQVGADLSPAAAAADAAGPPAGTSVPSPQQAQQEQPRLRAPEHLQQTHPPHQFLARSNLHLDANAATTPARPADIPSTPSVHQQQQQRLFVLQQQQQQQKQQLQEQQRQQQQQQLALHQQQLQLAQLDVASRLADTAAKPRPLSAPCRYCGRAYPAGPATLLRRHEQSCRGARRPSAHSNSADVPGMDRPSSPLSAPPGGATRDPAAAAGAEASSGAKAGTSAGADAGVETSAVGAAAADASAAAGDCGDVVMSSSLPSASPPPSRSAGRAQGGMFDGGDVGSCSAGSLATDGGLANTRNVGAPSRGAGGVEGGPSRRDLDLVAIVRRLERTIGGLDVSARLCLRDALVSLSNKASNPNMQPTPEQEALNRAAEYLVLRMLFLSGQQIPHTAPGTAAVPAVGAADVMQGIFSVAAPTGAPNGPSASSAYPAQHQQQQQHMRSDGSSVSAERGVVMHREVVKCEAGMLGGASPSDIKMEPGEAASPNMASSSTAGGAPGAPSGLSPGGGRRSSGSVPASLGLDSSKSGLNRT